MQIGLQTSIMLFKFRKKQFIWLLFIESKLVFFSFSDIVKNAEIREECGEHTVDFVLRNNKQIQTGEANLIAVDSGEPGFELNGDVDWDGIEWQRVENGLGFMCLKNFTIFQFLKKFQSLF